MIFEAGHYLCPDVQEIWERYQAVHAAVKAETGRLARNELPGGLVLRYFDRIDQTHYTYSARHGHSLAASAAQASATTRGTATGWPVERLIPVRYACTVDGATSNNSAVARTVNPMCACQARNSAGVMPAPAGAHPARADE